MRLLPLLIVGASALILSACDDPKPRKAPAPKAQASADCCCKDSCPNPPQAADTPVVGTLEEEGVKARRDGGHVRRVAHERRGGYRHRVRTGTEGVGYLDEDLAGDAYGYRRSYRSGTEGVGYLDDERGGGYRRVGTSVSVEERETYEESRRSSESGYRYSTGGGYEAYGSEDHDGYRGGHRKHGRRGGGGYAGVDRDGYLTWPGKTE